MFNDNKAYKVFCSYLREGLDSMTNVYTIWFTDLQMREMILVSPLLEKCT